MEYRSVPPLHHVVKVQSDQKTWMQVRAIHAQWRVQHTDIKMRDTVKALLRYALENSDAAMAYLESTNNNKGEWSRIQDEWKRKWGEV